jgi:steroid delta-isomerase-like uncharacterized protein
MSADNKAVVRRLIEAFNQGKLDDAANLMASDYVYHGPTGDAHGPAGWKQVAAMYHNAFPDVVCTIDDQIAEGDKVATRFTARGTHRGDLAGVAPTGRFVTVPVIIVSRVVNGRIVKDFEQFDQLGMFQTIGKLPASAASL